MGKRRKSIVAFALVIAFLVNIPLIASAANPSSWAVEQVNTAIKLNLVPAALQSNYVQPATRAEFCALAVALYESEKGEIAGRATFIDTKDINVEKAASIGIVSGIGNNMFAPDDRLTREQAAVMLARLADMMGKPFAKQTPTFSDQANIASWAIDGVGQVQAAGVMSGTGNNMFSPKSPYTREQCMITIVRMHDVMTGAAGNAPTQTILNSLPISESLKRGMTDDEFNQAYNIAYGIVSEYAGYSKEDQIAAVFVELANIRHGRPWAYSMEEKHYNNVYGFFVLNRTSCAGDVRAAALCLTILGIPWEHVNENQFAHQWIRLELGGDYIVLDVNAPYIDYELEPYKHPLIL